MLEKSKTEIFTSLKNEFMLKIMTLEGIAFSTRVIEVINDGFNALNKIVEFDIAVKNYDLFTAFKNLTLIIDFAFHNGNLLLRPRNDLRKLLRDIAEIVSLDAKSISSLFEIQEAQ